ncbi:MAG: hypothetical protein WCC14_04735, partial [Acidobacteriaceae bacterium]
VREEQRQVLEDDLSGYARGSIDIQLKNEAKGKPGQQGRRSRLRPVETAFDESAMFLELLIVCALSASSDVGHDTVPVITISAIAAST